MKTRIEGVTSCETPPVLPRNSPPLQASARPGRKESFFDALTLWNRICRLKPSCQRSLQIKTCAANECDLKALCLSLCRSSTSRLRGQSCSRHRCPGPRPSGGSPAWSSACRSLEGKITQIQNVPIKPWGDKFGFLPSRVDFLEHSPHFQWSWWGTWCCCPSWGTLAACLSPPPAPCTSCCPGRKPLSLAAGTCSTSVLWERRWIFCCSYTYLANIMSINCMTNIEFAVSSVPHHLRLQSTRQPTRLPGSVGR